MLLSVVSNFLYVFVMFCFCADLTASSDLHYDTDTSVSTPKPSADDGQLAEVLKSLAALRAEVASLKTPAALVDKNGSVAILDPIRAEIHDLKTLVASFVNDSKLDPMRSETGSRKMLVAYAPPVDMHSSTLDNIRAEIGNLKNFVTPLVGGSKMDLIRSEINRLRTFVAPVVGGTKLDLIRAEIRNLKTLIVEKRTSDVIHVENGGNQTKTSVWSVAELTGWSAVTGVTGYFDLASPSNSSQTCLDHCAAIAGCRGVSYNRDSRTCHGFADVTFLEKDKASSVILHNTSKTFLTKERTNYSGGASPKVMNTRAAGSREECRLLCLFLNWCLVATYGEARAGGTETGGCWMQSHKTFVSSVRDGKSPGYTSFVVDTRYN